MSPEAQDLEAGKFCDQKEPSNLHRSSGHGSSMPSLEGTESAEQCSKSGHLSQFSASIIEHHRLDNLLSKGTSAADGYIAQGVQGDSASTNPGPGATSFPVASGGQECMGHSK